MTKSPTQISHTSVFVFLISGFILCCKDSYQHMCGRCTPHIQALSIPLEASCPVATLRPKGAHSGGLVHFQENEPQERDPHRPWKQVQGHLGKECGSMISRAQSGAKAPGKYVSLAPHTPHSVFRRWPEEGQSKSL